MYAKFRYVSGSTAANIAADIIKLLTGTTDISQLSSNISKTNFSNISWTQSSAIGSGFSGLTVNALVGQYVHYNGDQIGTVQSNDATTVTLSTPFSGTTGTGTTYIVDGFAIWHDWQTAGWTIHDANAGTGLQVLRQLWDTSLGSGYVYMGVDYNRQSGYITLRLWETWNANTHSGTNEAYSAANQTNLRYYLTDSNGWVYLSSSPWHAAITGITNYGYNGNASNGPTGIFQRTRWTAWDTNANAYPPVVAFHPDASDMPINSIGQVPRYCGSGGSDVTGSSAITYYSSLFGTCFGGTNRYPNGLTTIVPNANKISQHLFVPLWCVGNAGFLGGDCSGFSDFWHTTSGMGNNQDEVIQNGKTYVLWTSGTWRHAVRKG